MRFAKSQVYVLLAAVTPAAFAAGDDGQPDRTRLLAQMRSLAEETKVLVEAREAQLVKNPVFRYDDKPRRFIDATMWIWTDGLRPIACQKIEAKLHLSTGEPQWGYCFTSLSERKLSVDWSPQRNWRSTEAGLAFVPIPDAPGPADRTVQRRRQARELAREFSGRVLLNRATNSSAELRLLTTPIFEYSQDDLLIGAVFGLETNGTNPDVLLLLEVRDEDKPAWHFAPARMTTGGVTLNYRDAKVWEAAFVTPHQGPFSNWLFFPTRRAVVAEE